MKTFAVCHLKVILLALEENGFSVAAKDGFMKSVLIQMISPLPLTSFVPSTDSLLGYVLC